MKILVLDGMVNIDTEDIAYANIRSMYTTGNGCGLQLSEKAESRRGEIGLICDCISDYIYSLQRVLNEIQETV